WPKLPDRAKSRTNRDLSRHPLPPSDDRTTGVPSCATPAVAVMIAAFRCRYGSRPWRDPGAGCMKPSFCSDADRETVPIDRLSPIHPEAEQRLRRSNYLALQDVRCFATDDAVYLYGRLPSFYLKQVAH